MAALTNTDLVLRDEGGQARCLCSLNRNHAAGVWEKKPVNHGESRKGNIQELVSRFLPFGDFDQEFALLNRFRCNHAATEALKGFDFELKGARVR